MAQVILAGVGVEDGLYVFQVGTRSREERIWAIQSSCLGLKAGPKSWTLQTNM